MVSPAIWASRTSGRTPIAPTTSSPGITRRSARITPFEVTSATATPVSTATPWASSSAATAIASSGSRAVRICPAASTTVTVMPVPARFSAVSRPTNPPPMTTAVAGLPVTSAARRSASSTVRSTRSRPDPGIGGRTGSAPGLSTSLSYRRAVIEPSTVERTATRWRAGSIPTTSAFTRTSSRKRSNRRPAVWRRRSSSSSMTPPTKYGRPQFAYETWPERSTTVIEARSSRRRNRVAADMPPATPPTMTTRIVPAASSRSGA